MYTLSVKDNKGNSIACATQLTISMSIQSVTTTPTQVSTTLSFTVLFSDTLSADTLSTISKVSLIAPSTTEKCNYDKLFTCG